MTHKPYLGDHRVISGMPGSDRLQRPSSDQALTENGSVRGELQKPWPQNLLATLGFLCSTVGLVTAGVAAPLGLLLSLLALNNARRRHASTQFEIGTDAAHQSQDKETLSSDALAGVVIGLLGCIETMCLLLGLSLISSSHGLRISYFLATRFLGVFLWCRLYQRSARGFAIVSVVLSAGLGLVSIVSELRVIEVYEWQLARKSNTVEALRRYATGYPQGWFINDIQQRQAALLADPAPFRAAVAMRTAAALRRFLENFPGHAQTDEAKQALARIDEENAWNHAASGDTIRTLLEYLAQYPQGRFKKEGKARCAALSMDESLYLKALQEGTVQAIGQFIQDFPGHVKEAEARPIYDRLLEESIWSQAKTIRALQDYAKSYPKGRFVSDSVGKRALLIEDDIPYWAALKLASAAGLQQFLQDFPGHVREPVIQRLSAIVSGKSNPTDSGRSELFRGPVFPLPPSSWDNARTIGFYSSAESVVGHYNSSFENSTSQPAIQITARVVFVDKDSPDRVRVVHCVAVPASEIKYTRIGSNPWHAQKLGFCTMIDGVRTEQESDLNQLLRLAANAVTRSD